MSGGTGDLSNEQKILRELHDLRLSVDEIRTFLGGSLRERGLVSRVDELTADVRALEAQAGQTRSGLWEVVKIGLGALAGAVAGLITGGNHWWK